MPEASPKTSKRSKVLVEFDPRTACDVIAGVDSDVVMERGERKWFTDSEAATLLALTFDGRPILRKAEPDAEIES